MTMCDANMTSTRSRSAWPCRWRKVPFTLVRQSPNCPRWCEYTLSTDGSFSLGLTAGQTRRPRAAWWNDGAIRLCATSYYVDLCVSLHPTPFLTSSFPFP